MRFSVLTALCMAPLALAGTLQADLHARGVMGEEAGLVVRTEEKDSKSEGQNKQESNKDDNKGGNKDNNGGNGGNKVIIEQSSTTQVIIIWYNQGGNAATTTVTETKTVTGAAGAPAAAAATHNVVVGGAGGLVYTPSEIVAAPGDMVIFEFQSQNHTATQSAFDTPCKKLEGGMDTGFMANPNNTVSPAPQMAMQVIDTKPIWFYCKQKTHCGKGMVFSINPTAEKTQAMFQNMAIAQNGTGATAPIAGGAAAPAAPAVSTTLSTAAAPAATPPAEAAPAAPAPAAPAAGGAAGTGMTAGTGTVVQGGACACSCLCGVAAFPQAAQGIASFGGMSGAMPMSALEA